MEVGVMKSYRESKTQTDKTHGESTAGAEELAQKIAKAYNGKSNMAMMRNILQEAEKSKRAGTLSNEEIEAFYQSFAPMLSPPQRKQLRVIVDKLKAI
jgi:DNA replication protein DnaD